MAYLQGNSRSPSPKERTVPEAEAEAGRGEEAGVQRRKCIKSKRVHHS